MRRTKVVFTCLIGFLVQISASCPNLKDNAGCSTGSCRSGGLKGTWTLPVSPTAICDEACQQGLETNHSIVNHQLSPYVSALDCCIICKSNPFCKFWQLVPKPIAPGKGSCFVYDFNPPACDTTPPIESYAGAKCTLPGANNDPHMVGAHGTRFDFNGLPEKSYCFITDRDLHMNIKMTGYLDTRNESATAFKDGKAVRTWIRELGLVWFEGGISHSFELSARNNGRVERGAGFLNYSKFDGEKMAQLSVGKSFEKGNLKFHFVAIEKSGPFEVDFYTLKIEGLLVMELRLRVANALLRRQEDAEAHINIGINYLNAGSRVHGILGQTFRKDREKRALTFKRVSAMIHGDIAADGKSGKGFLDGTPKDYITSDVMATDCKFSKFSGRPIFTSVE